jgi:hypothetical protein
MAPLGLKRPAVTVTATPFGTVRRQRHEPVGEPNDIAWAITVPQSLEQFGGERDARWRAGVSA